MEFLVQHLGSVLGPGTNPAPVLRASVCISPAETSGVHKEDTDVKTAHLPAYTTGRYGQKLPGMWLQTVTIMPMVDGVLEKDTGHRWRAG